MTSELDQSDCPETEDLFVLFLSLYKRENLGNWLADEGFTFLFDKFLNQKHGDKEIIYSFYSWDVEHIKIMDFFIDD